MTYNHPMNDLRIPLVQFLIEVTENTPPEAFDIARIHKINEWHGCDSVGCVLGTAALKDGVRDVLLPLADKTQLNILHDSLQETGPERAVMLFKLMMCMLAPMPEYIRLALGSGCYTTLSDDGETKYRWGTPEQAAANLTVWLKELETTSAGLPAPEGET